MKHIMAYILWDHNLKKQFQISKCHGTIKKRLKFRFNFFYLHMTDFRAKYNWGTELHEITLVIP